MTADMPPSTRRGLILCVEDEDELRSDLAEELEDAGYTVVEARNGEQALEQIRVIHPDLILCDINMPSGNGYALLESLQQQFPHMADVPFVFLTALADPREVVEGKKRGADDYLVKPIDFDLLLATIDARLRQVASIRQCVMDGANLPDTSTHAKGGTRDGLFRTLDYISLGVVMLDRNGRVEFANRAARTLASEGKGISIGTTLVIDDPQAAKALSQGIGGLLEAGAYRDNLPASVSIPRPEGQRDILALALPLQTTGRALADAIAVFLCDPNTRSPVPDNVLANLFGLTPAEAQVATLLAQGRRTDQIADALGVSPTTVAFHVRNLLGKTHTHRQTDLVALLLTGPMALSFQSEASPSV